MDRSNFNPDQLHEHFDRIKGTFGVELEDNGRMIKLPTGQRFGVGGSRFDIHDTPDYPNEVRIPLLTEVGRVGLLDLAVDRAKVSLVNMGNNQSRYEDFHRPNNVPKIRTMHILPLDEQNDEQDVTGSRRFPENEILGTVTVNPSKEFIDRVVTESMPFAKRDSESLDNPATFNIRRHPDLSDFDIDAVPSWFTQNPIQELGRMSMNRQSGRFEWIPD